MRIYVASSWRNDFQPGVVSRIACVAIKYEGKIYEGYRNHGVMRTGYGLPSGAGVAGFLTDHHEFLEPEHAAEVAFAATQIAAQKTKLTSEDLWPD